MRIELSIHSTSQIYALFFCLALSALPLGTNAQSQADDVDYLQQRQAFAASSDFDAYALTLLQTVSLQEFESRIADPNLSIEQVNQPLMQLIEAYPLSIQGNLAVSEFLEYVASLSDNPEQASALRTVSEERRARAEMILASITNGKAGDAPAEAYWVITQLEEYAVLDSLSLSAQEQSVMEFDSVPYDVWQCIDENGEPITVYFDISAFYGQE